MPTYGYEEVLPDGSPGNYFECEHPMQEPLRTHPESGLPVRRVYSAPNLAVRYTPGNTKKLLSNENLSQKGFTKYERDKLSGQYHKVAGEGPSVIKRPPA
jgi:hypothetical protein